MSRLVDAGVLAAVIGTRVVSRALRLVVCLLPLLPGGVAANTTSPWDYTTVYESTAFSLGVGAGIVQFDTNVKISEEGERSRFIDLEGNLGLPDDDNVRTIYGAYRFNDKHSIVFGYFSINRESNFLSIDESFGDIVLVSATVDILDESEFYNISYGYNLYRDDRSSVTFIAGLNNLDLKLSAEATGQITIGSETVTGTEVADADIFAPLPLLGFNLGFSFTPKWSVTTRFSLVSGSYQETSATLWQVSVNSLYRFNDHLGGLLGLTYFDASVDIDDDDELTEVVYRYNGAFIGLHLGF